MSSCLDNVLSLVDKIKRTCCTVADVKAINEEFNKIGLAVIETVNGSYILCRVKNGKPITEKVFHDYVYIGEIHDKHKELTERFITCLTNFISKNAHNEEVKIEDNSKSYSNPYAMYGKAIKLHNDVDIIYQGVKLHGI